jgi:putative ABC transport system permease protein
MLDSRAFARTKGDDVKRSERIYRWLLRFYPRDFRDEYGEEMSIMFRGRATDGSFRLWVQVLGDLLFHAPKEHWSTLKEDLRYALRALRNAPAFAATVIATLALGIGANSVIFTAVDAVLLRDARVSDPDSLVDVYTSSQAVNPYSRSSYPDYFDLRDSGTFASLAAYTELPITMDANGQPEPLAGQLVSGNYFEVLGIKIPFGRGFTPDDDRIGVPAHVAVISHALWQRVFNADQSVIGQTIRLNSNSYTLIGVAPRGFAGPLLGVAADVWVPTALQPEVNPVAAAVRRARGHSAIFDLRSSRGLRIVGRLPAGASIDQVSSRAEVISSRLQTAYPNTNRNRRFILTPLGEGRGLRVDTRPVLRILAGLVLMVLIVACVNVASLLLARAVSREKEVAVRLAIGASRARLVRQWLTESMLLGILGSIGALLITGVSTPLLHTFVIPEAVDLSVNARVLAFTFLVGVGSGLLFGLAPVFQALRRNTNAVLGNRGAAANGARAARMRRVFVVLQIAASLVLLVGAGLFLRTLENAYSVELSYPVDQTLVASLNLEAHGYFEGGSRGPDAGLALYEQILSRVRAVPGVATAAAARMTVLSGGARSTDVSTDGRPIKDSSNALGVRANVVSQGYFETMTIPILHGRSFHASDGPKTPRVTIVSKSLADRIWPNEDPIGKTLRDGNNELQVIVGVVPDMVYTTTLERDRPPTYYLLLAQNYESGAALHVRAASNPVSLVPAIREAVREVDSQLAVERPQLLRDVLDRTLSQQRMMATLVGLFGGVALILAVLGLYGVMAHVATQRTPEIGIRLAMGAQPASIVTLLLGQGLRLLGIGVAIGLAGALVGTRYIEAQLFGVTATDPVTFVSGCAVLAIAGLTASLIPALRAMRVDPVIALRRT